MQINSLLALVAYLAGQAIALPASSSPRPQAMTPHHLNATTATMDEGLAPRGKGPTAPRDRLIIDQMRFDGLPHCHFQCFEQENGKTGVDIYSQDLHHFCDFPHRLGTAYWIMWHIQDCLEKDCRPEEEDRDKSNIWMDKTCGEDWTWQ